MNSSPLDFEKVVKDPWYFLTHCVKTRDPQDLEQSIKKFPDHKYLELLTRIWMRERLLLVPKSRRMMLSWFGQAIFMHDAAYNVGRDIGFVSKKEDDADEAISRVEFMLKNLEMPKDLIPKYKRTYCLIEFTEMNSRIIGFPSGSDQLRSYGLSGILADEMAFWDMAPELYAASMPTIEGGGRFFGISSPAVGFFYKMVFDAIDAESSDDVNEDLIDVEIHRPMKGLRVWKNKKNGFWVFEPHWSCNPDKDPKIQEQIKNSMPLEKYLQEYELKWKTFAGKGVYADTYVPEKHVSKTQLEPDLNLPLILGFDFGLTPACLVCQLWGEKLVVFKEYVAFNMGLERFLKTILLPGLFNDFRRWPDLKRDYIVVVDPAGFIRKDTDESKCSDLLADSGFSPEPGPVTWEERKGSVEHFLSRFTKEGTCFLLNLTGVNYLKKGFEGGYHYGKNIVDIQPDAARPVKNMYSHIHDALQYVAWRAKFLNRRRTKSPPKPSYSWSKNGK